MDVLSMLFLLSVKKRSIGRSQITINEVVRKEAAEWL